MDLFYDQKHRSHSRRSLTLTSCDIVELVQEKTVESKGQQPLQSKWAIFSPHPSPINICLEPQNIFVSSSEGDTA